MLFPSGRDKRERLLDDFETFIFETFIDVGYIGERFCKEVARRGRIIGRKLKYGSDIVLGTGKNMIVTGPGIAMDGVRKSKDIMAEGIQLSFDMTGIGWAALHGDIASHKPISRTLKSFTENNVDPDQLRFEIAWFTLKFVGTVGLEPLARAEGNAFGEASVTGDYAKAAAVNEMLLVFSAFAKSARGPRAMTKARAPRAPKKAVAPKTTGGPKPSPKFKPPTNPAQAPPAKVPPGWRVRQMPPTKQYPDGYWKLEKPLPGGHWQPIDPSTMKPGARWETHVPLPPSGS